MQRHKFELRCTFDYHDQSPIVGVCVNDKCSQKRPFCVGCQYQFHSSHLKDLRRFDDFKNSLHENSQLTEKLKNHLNDLQQLVKLISHLIEATQYENNEYNLQEMNYTDLDNRINKLITLWNQQRYLCELLQETFSMSVKNKINTLQLEIQKKPNNVPLNSKQLKTEVPKMEDKELNLPDPQHFIPKKRCFQINELSINSSKNSTSFEMPEGIKQKQNSLSNQDNQKFLLLQKGYFNSIAIPRQKSEGLNNLESPLSTSKLNSKPEKKLDNQKQEQVQKAHCNSFIGVKVIDQLSNTSKMMQRSEKKCISPLKCNNKILKH